MEELWCESFNSYFCDIVYKLKQTKKKLYFQKVYVEVLIYLLAKWYIFIIQL